MTTKPNGQEQPSTSSSPSSCSTLVRVPSNTVPSNERATSTEPSSASPLSPVLPVGTFVEQLEALQVVPFNLSSARGKPTLEQTKRNKMRNELLDSLTAYLDAVLDGTGVAVFRVGEGVALEVPNEHVYAKQVAANLTATTNGTITLTLDLTVQNLEYDAYQENIDWEEDYQAKLEQAKARQAKKDQAEAKRKKKTQDSHTQEEVK